MAEHGEVLLAHVGDEVGEAPRAPGLGSRERAPPACASRQVAVLGPPLQPVRRSPAGAARSARRTSGSRSTKNEVEVAGVLAQVGAAASRRRRRSARAPAGGTRRAARATSAARPARPRRRRRTGSRRGGRASPRSVSSRSGPIVLKIRQVSVAHRRRREAGEVDAAAAVVAAVVREPRRLPDRVDGHRLADGERADAAGVVLARCGVSAGAAPSRPRRLRSRSPSALPRRASRAGRSARAAGGCRRSARRASPRCRPRPAPRSRG